MCVSLCDSAIKAPSFASLFSFNLSTGTLCVRRNPKSFQLLPLLAELAGNLELRNRVFSANLIPPWEADEVLDLKLREF